MNLLLDTYVFLWWREASTRLKRDAKRAISDADTVFVSAASAWEVGIKIALKKLSIPGPLETAVEQSGFEKLLVGFGHAAAGSTLAPTTATRSTSCSLRRPSPRD